MKKTPLENTGKISFPCVWEYRLFFRAGETSGSDENIRKAAAEAGVTPRIEPGKSSSSGSYQSIRVSGVVDSLETAEKWGRSLGAIPGVKFLL